MPSHSQPRDHPLRSGARRVGRGLGHRMCCRKTAGQQEGYAVPLRVFRDGHTAFVVIDVALRGKGRVG